MLGGSLLPENFCECHAGQRAECVRAGDCSLRALWRSVDDAVRGVLAGVTLHDLHRGERSLFDLLGSSPIAPPIGSPT